MDSKKTSFGARASFRALRERARDSLRKSEQRKKYEAARTAYGLSPWPAFRTDAGEYVSHFNNLFPGAKDKILDKIAAKRAFGKRVIIVDLGGMADATSIGADKTISIALPARESKRQKELRPKQGPILERLEPHPGHTILRGDILSHRGLQTLIDLVRTEGESVTYAFMIPGGAARDHTHNPYSYRRVSRVLRRLNPLLGADGEMYLDLDYLDHEITPTHLADVIGRDRVLVDRGNAKNALHVTQVPLQTASPVP